MTLRPLLPSDIARFVEHCDDREQADWYLLGLLGLLYPNGPILA